MVGGEAAHRLDLELAVVEPADQPARVAAVGVDLVAGPDPALHVEDAGEQLDDAVARGADDERRPAGVLVGADLGDHLRVDPRQDRLEQVGEHPLQRPLRHAAEQSVDLLDERVGVLIGRAAEPEPQVVEPPPQRPGRG